MDTLLIPILVGVQAEAEAQAQPEANAEADLEAEDYQHAETQEDKAENKTEEINRRGQMHFLKELRFCLKVIFRYFINPKVEDQPDQ